MDLSQVQYLYIALAALIVGFTKTSVGGMGILAVPLMALAIEGKASSGALLPMLVMADIFAVIFYRRKCQWNILVKLLPLTLIGVVAGYFLLDIISTQIFGKLIGIVIFVFLLLEFLSTKTNAAKGGGWWFTGIAGIIAGIATMIANAAGPIFGIYMLRMGLGKEEFVGTRSWFFLMLNLLKLPFSANLGLISAETLKLNFLFLPVILIGALIGYWVLGLINITLFKWIIRCAALAAAIGLVF